MEDLCVLIFFYMVQSLLMILAGAQFFNLKISKKQIIFISISYGLAIWVVRGFYQFFHIPFGTHTLILAIIFSLIIKIFTKTSIDYAIGISLLSLCLVMLGGGIGGLIHSLISLSYEEVLNNVLLHIFFGHLENSILIIFLIISKVYNFNISTIGEKESI